MRLMMDDQIYEKYKCAGKVAAEACAFGQGLIKEGVGFLEVADRVEALILKRGAGLAFPVNLSVNEVAAHFSPHVGDSLVFQRGDVVKLDVGAHVEGYIADVAVTVEVGTREYKEMINASAEALEKAVGMMSAGVDLRKVGGVVEETIMSYGYQHHYPFGYGSFSEAAIELCHWIGIEPTQKKEYTNYLESS